MMPLAPLEEYMLLDDRADYPMISFYILRFSGSLTRTVFERALCEVIKKYPRLCAIASRTCHGKWHWLPAGKDHEFILWTNNKTDLVPRMPFDIRVRPGVFLTACQTATGTDLLFQFHHSCCDGKESFSFIGDVFAAYTALSDSSSSKIFSSDCPPEEPNVDKRDGAGFTWRNVPRAIRRVRRILESMRVFFMRSPIPLIPAGPANSENSVCPDLLSRISTRFDVDETERLLVAARKQGVMGNDLLVRDIFQAIGTWMQRNAPTDSQDWLRFCVPVDIRMHEELRNLKGNGASYIFLDRRLCDLNDPDRLLSGIHQEMEVIKRRRLDLTFIRGMRILSMFPGARKWIIARNTCQATCVVTNLGRILNRHRLPRREGRIVLGEGVLENIEIIAPLRPLTSVAFAIHYYARMLAITLHYDSLFFTKRQAEEMLTLYTYFLRLSMEKTMASRSMDLKSNT